MCFNISKYHIEVTSFGYIFQNKSKKKKKNEPPTWKEIRDAYLKSQESDEERMQKYSPNRHLEGIAMAIGFIGMIVAVSLLLAYVIVQAPQLRRKIGNCDCFTYCLLHQTALPKYD